MTSVETLPITAVVRELRMTIALLAIGCLVMIMGIAMADYKKETLELILCGLMMICGAAIIITAVLTR